MANVLRITSVPPGEAPLWVREKWVGLELPLATQSSEPVNAGVFGVLSGPRSILARIIALLAGQTRPMIGFVVDPRTAIAILEHADPEAAAWWRKNVPHMFQPGRSFVFAEGCGEIIPREGASART